MTISLKNEFRVPVEVNRAWEVLSDIPFVASCLPGAAIVRQDDDGGYIGTVGLKVGPVSLQYNGKAEIVTRDDPAYKMIVRATGKDTKGQGTASALITLTLEADGSESLAQVVTDVDVTGKVAQFGRGPMQQVAGRMVGQFAKNLQEKLGVTDSQVRPDTSRLTGSFVQSLRSPWTIAGLAIASSSIALVIRKYLKRRSH